MAETTTITVELSPELSARLDRLSQLSETSRSALAAEALEAFVARELELMEKSPEGIVHDDAGRVLTDAEVMKELDAVHFLTLEQIEHEMPRILQSIADADAGRVHTHEEVMAEAGKIIARASANRRSA